MRTTSIPLCATPSTRINYSMAPKNPPGTCVCTMTSNSGEKSTRIPNLSRVNVVAQLHELYKQGRECGRVLKRGSATWNILKMMRSRDNIVWRKLGGLCA